MFELSWCWARTLIEVPALLVATSMGVTHVSVCPVPALEFPVMVLLVAYAVLPLGVIATSTAWPPGSLIGSTVPLARLAAKIPFAYAATYAVLPSGVTAKLVGSVLTVLRATTSRQAPVRRFIDTNLVLVPLTRKPSANRPLGAISKLAVSGTSIDSLIALPTLSVAVLMGVRKYWAPSPLSVNA